MSTEDWTMEDVERLARWMGWERVDEAPDVIVWTYGLAYYRVFNSGSLEVFRYKRPGIWNPFFDASDDYDVLQRAREVWRHDGEIFEDRRWRRFTDDLTYSERYTPGAWSRAVLAVLKAEEAR